MIKTLFIYIAVIVFITSLSYCADSSNFTPTTTTEAHIGVMPVIELSNPASLLRIATNCLFFGTIRNYDDELETVEIRFDDHLPQPLSIIGDEFRFQTNLTPVSNVRVIITVSYTNNPLASITNHYEVAIPDVSDWTISVRLHNEGWVITETNPLTVSIVPRTNDGYIMDTNGFERRYEQFYYEGDGDITITFTNLSQNIWGVNDGYYTCFVYLDDNTNRRLDLMREFPLRVEEVLIDGVNDFETVLNLYLVTGRITNQDPLPGSNYFVIISPSGTAGQIKTYGIGGGQVGDSDPMINYFDYRVACTRCGTFYIIGLIAEEIHNDIQVTSGMYAGFHNAFIFPFLKPFSPSAEIKPTGTNCGFSFRLGRVP